MQITKLSIIIPAYNEGKTIRNVLENVANLALVNDIEKEIIVINDCSTDNTLDEIQQEYDRLVDAKNLEGSIRFQRQCLMGVVTGFEFLNGKFNVFL